MQWATYGFVLGFLDFLCDHRNKRILSLLVVRDIVQVYCAEVRKVVKESEDNKNVVICFFCHFMG